MSLRFYIAGVSDTPLVSAEHERVTSPLAAALEQEGLATRSSSANSADFIVLNEAWSYKDWRYVARLEADTFAFPNSHRLYTVNSDDWATGLLRGGYLWLPASRLTRERHRAIPWPLAPNEHVASVDADRRFVSPKYTASWRGNVTTSNVRRRILDRYGSDPRFLLEPTSSWWNHEAEEKEHYIDVILAGKFSLCPRGLAPGSFRTYESMALSRAPVNLADGFVPPDGPDWASCSLQVREREVNQLAEFLTAREGDAERLGRAARHCWEEHFAPTRIWPYIAKQLIDLVSSAPTSSPQTEREIWNSVKMRQQNGWRLDQRLSRRIRTTLAKARGLKG